MDAFTLHLLGMAVEVCPDLRMIRGDGHVQVRAWITAEIAWRNFYGDTLAEALSALLTDLGVTVPERPSAERVSHMVGIYAHSLEGDDAFTVTDLRDLYAREPLTVLALLEGGAP